MLSKLCLCLSAVYLPPLQCFIVIRFYSFIKINYTSLYHSAAECLIVTGQKMLINCLQHHGSEVVMAVIY